jgi:hypothetical protein
LNATDHPRDHARHRRKRLGRAHPRYWVASPSSAAFASHDQNHQPYYYSIGLF